MGARLREHGYLRVHPPHARLEPGTLVYLGGSAEAPTLRVACWADQAFPGLMTAAVLRDGSGQVLNGQSTFSLDAGLLAGLRERHPWLKRVDVTLEKAALLKHSLADLSTYRDKRSKACLAAVAKLQAKKRSVYGVIGAWRANLRYRVLPPTDSARELALRSDLLPGGPKSAVGAPTKEPRCSGRESRAQRNREMGAGKCRETGRRPALTALGGGAATGFSAFPPPSSKGWASGEAYFALSLQPLVGPALTTLFLGTIRLKEPLSPAACKRLVERTLWVSAARSLADPPAPNGR